MTGAGDRATCPVDSRGSRAAVAGSTKAHRPADGGSLGLRRGVRLAREAAVARCGESPAKPALTWLCGARCRLRWTGAGSPGALLGAVRPARASAGAQQTLITTWCTGLAA